MLQLWLNGGQWIVEFLRPSLHDTTGCQNRLNNRFDNRLYRVNGVSVSNSVKKATDGQHPVDFESVKNHANGLCPSACLSHLCKRTPRQRLCAGEEVANVC